MSDVIVLEKVDEVYMKVLAEPSVLQELSEFFAFRPNNYQFNPKYKARVWDGFVRLITPFKPYLYIGLLDHLKHFCETREYELQTDGQFDHEENVPDDYGYELAKLYGTDQFELHDYQNDYIVNAIRSKRSLSLSPTSSGKSYIQYLITQHYYRSFKHRVLIIVPTIALVHQMAGDFEDYGCDPSLIYKIQSGVDKNTNAQFIISTWQSLQRLPKDWFNQFRVVLGDEAHLFTGKSLQGIMEKCTEAPYKFGFTGTVSSDSKTHELVLQGLFGKLIRYVSTKNLIDRGTVANFKIKALVLNYPQDTKDAFRKNVKALPSTKRYHAEREFLANNTKRNNFIRNLLWSLEGQNNLVLFDLVEKHGKILEPLLRREGRHLHFIYGNTPGEERERIRHLIENDNINTVILHFGTNELEINENSKVLLTDGSEIDAKDLNTNHDISTEWIKANIK